MTILQEDLLRRGPFGVTFRELAILGECSGYYRFTPTTIKFFHAHYPESPLRIDGYAYVIEISSAGPHMPSGRIMRLIQFDISDPCRSIVAETGKAAVKRVWQALYRQALHAETEMFNKGLI